MHSIYLDAVYDNMQITKLHLATDNSAYIIIIIIAKTSKAPLTGAQRRRTVHAYT